MCTAHCASVERFTTREPIRCPAIGICHYVSHVSNRTPPTPYGMTIIIASDTGKRAKHFQWKYSTKLKIDLHLFSCHYDRFNLNHSRSANRLLVHPSSFSRKYEKVPRFYVISSISFYAGLAAWQICGVLPSSELGGKASHRSYLIGPIRTISIAVWSSNFEPVQIHWKFRIAYLNKIQRW